MKSISTRVTLLFVMASLALMAGCLVEQSGSHLVVEETICVNIDTRITDPNFSAAVVCDAFQERLEKLMQEHDLTYEDIVDCSIVSGSYHSLGPVHKSPFYMEGAVTMERQDNPPASPTDGPEPFLNFTAHNVADLKGKKIPADLNEAGVGVVNRALEAVKNGENPRLVMRLVDAEFDPEPSTSNPLEFRWQACVAFQFVLESD